MKSYAERLPAPNEFEAIDKAVCALVQVDDALRCGFEIYCAECNGATECYCKGGSVEKIALERKVSSMLRQTRDALLEDTPK